MANVEWTMKALTDLDRIDAWREEDLDLPPISGVIMDLVKHKFAGFDLQRFRLGTPVTVRGEPRDLFLCLVNLKKSEPYKIFYRILGQTGIAQIRRVRHPRQKPLPGTPRDAGSSTGWQE